ncbi:MAG: SRPBCC family protein [Candidatus Marinimicrobia bacterium]|nr:SRPBCC family protein [Candidatus Neomarinimicrobiota bacterium]MCF7827796.1 SRPBCC family protein [Candidatus Neomarinimicrobiota bacterium]MCF7879449.1 SRPBCC family protein [Candidatus Neomarinimicrobiota bacterium]
MIRVQYETIIDRSLTDVFDRLIDINGYPDWLPKSKVFLHCRKTSEGPIGKGTTFIDETRVGTYTGEVLEFERPTKITFRNELRWFGLRVMETYPAYELESVEDGTRVRHHAEGKMFGLFKLMQPYVAMRAKEERIRTVEMLKKSLEAEAASQ